MKEREVSARYNQVRVGSRAAKRTSKKTTISSSSCVVTSSIVVKAAFPLLRTRWVCVRRSVQIVTVLGGHSQAGESLHVDVVHVTAVFLNSWSEGCGGDFCLWAGENGETDWGPEAGTAVAEELVGGRWMLGRPSVERRST